MDRRRFFLALAAPLGAVLSLQTGTADAATGRPRRIRHRVRHRIRRRVAIRTIRGRPVLVVPTGLAVGWELQHLSRVVLVRGFRVEEIAGARSEVALVVKGGVTEEIPILREDTHDNSQNLPGSAIDATDLAAPAIEDAV
jgi:hypothetical protein